MGIKSNFFDDLMDSISYSELYFAKFDKPMKIVFNDPATILFVNGKKYVSKAHEEKFDKEKGLLMCLAKANGITHTTLQKLIKSATTQENKPKKVTKQTQKSSKKKV